MAMLLIWVWVNDSFRILKQLGLIVLARLEVVCQCLSILGMVLWEQERISGDRQFAGVLLSQTNKPARKA